MRKAWLPILLCALVLLFSACGTGGNNQPYVPTAPQKTTGDQSAAEPMEETEKNVFNEEEEFWQEETAPEAFFLGVTDASVVTKNDVYDGEKIRCYHIPMVETSGGNALSVNDKMYAELSAFQEKHLYNDPVYYDLGMMHYMWWQNDPVASIVVMTSMHSYAYADFFIYNVSTETGEEYSDREVLEVYGLSVEEYEAMLRSTVEAYYAGKAESILAFAGQDTYDKLLRNSLAEATLSGTRPFIGADGHLCAKINIYWFAGADCNFDVFDLVTQEIMPFEYCTGEHAS